MSRRPLPPLPSLAEVDAAHSTTRARSQSEPPAARKRSGYYPADPTQLLETLHGRFAAAERSLRGLQTQTEQRHQSSLTRSVEYDQGPIVLSTGQQVEDLSHQLYTFATGTNMSANNGQQNNHFPAFDGSAGNGNNRSGASPSSSHGGAANGNGINGAVNYMAPLPVGHQQDINFLYAQIQELTALLKSNREKVAVITRQAEEVARRANGHLGDGEGDRAHEAARVRELELDLAKAQRIIEIYKEEQVENTALIGQYEDALGTATDQIREYCVGINDRFLAQKRHYNNLLQAEKDEHLETRLDRDVWMAKTMRVCEMIRTASRLRNEEWGDEVEVIAGLQYQVRMYRNALGLEPEKKEEETGWPWLKDVPAGPDGLSEYDG